MLDKIDSFLWDNCLIFLLIGTGLYLTIYLKGIQFRYLFTSLKLAFSKHDDTHAGDISQFQSLMTSLAATIGIGSIAGMATAVMAGGYGAIFWMWVVALIGMATKYAEGILAVKFRLSNAKGEMKGGPMYYLRDGLKQKWLGIAFAFFGIMAACGGGNLIQSQSISDAIRDIFPIPAYMIGIVLSLFTAVVIFGGIKKLGKVNAFLVPIMALLYVIFGLGIVIIHADKLLVGLKWIFLSAFNGKAAFGGLAGIGVMNAMQMGIARGISSNEAGLGSGPIASAAAKTDTPAKQALISMSSVFLSSFFVCTITVLVLAVSGVIGTTNASGALLNGAPLVMHAFSKTIPFGNIIVAIGLILFGFSTILGWAYYGEKCMEFLFHERGVNIFRIFFTGFVFLGSIASLEVVWPIADIMNGLMALPNLIGILLLAKVVRTESTALVGPITKLSKT